VPRRTRCVEGVLARSQERGTARGGPHSPIFAGGYHGCVLGYPLARAAIDSDGGNRLAESQMSAAVSCSHAAVAVTVRKSTATRRTSQTAARLPTRKQLCGARLASGATCARVVHGSVTTHAGITPVKFSFGAFPTLSPLGCHSPGATIRAGKPQGLRSGSAGLPSIPRCTPCDLACTRICGEYATPRKGEGTLRTIG
jgi:hypothetical protein